jgi:hypothetical protein
MRINPHYDATHIVVRLTPKALRMNELRAGGMTFDHALAQADSEFSQNGWSRKYQELQGVDLHTKEATDATTL